MKKNGWIYERDERRIMKFSERKVRERDMLK